MKRVAIGLLWLALVIVLMSCDRERGASVDPSFNDGFPEQSIPSIVETDVPLPTPTQTPTPTPEVVEPELTMYYTEEEVIQVAKLLYQEARGVLSDTRVACVAWIVCNRVDGGYGDTISQIWGYPQLWYEEHWPVTDRMYRIASDVLERWNYEKNFGYCEGRVLPPDYFWYTGDGENNNFRNVFCDYDNIWDYSLPSPYDS